MSDMIEVVIGSILVSLMSQQRVIILREINFDRYLPIMVGIYEAEHLTLALQEIAISRPLTYELFSNTLDDLNIELLHVEIVALRDETYYGNLVLSVDGVMHSIDARPSDAINLAVRQDVPILVDRNVMDEAGLIPEEDLAEDTDADNEPSEPIEEERLSIFEDYLEQLSPDQEEDNKD
ncbi:MAG: bifunctional nuclease family protein [Chloroflexota bacterium]|nr:bifunctional nuclease family protein [Chloroflexota bacterium]